MFVHMAPEPLAKKIKRNGVAPRRLRSPIEGHDRFVWAFPVLESFVLTHQWTRELKRLGTHALVAVTFRIPDGEPVLVHHYNAQPERATAAEAVAFIRNMADARGGEVMIPRRIDPREIVRVRSVPQNIGWRYYPDVKTRGWRPCDCPACAPRGEVKARRYRNRIPMLARRWDERHSGS